MATKVVYLFLAEFKTSTIYPLRMRQATKAPGRHYYPVKILGLGFKNHSFRPYRIAGGTWCHSEQEIWLSSDFFDWE